MTPSALADRLPDRPGPQDVLILDLRPTEHYVRGHLPGAVHLDLFGITSIDTGPAPLRAFMWIVAYLLVARGVRADRAVVVYDQHSGMRAARAFWFLEYFNHPDTRLLDGGYDGWVRCGLPVSTAPYAPISRDQGARWPTTERSERLATWSDVKDRLGQPEVLLLDVRSAAEYDGTDVRAARGGTIPGAVHVEWTRNLNAQGAFKSVEELDRLYREAGLTRAREVVTYCQGGYRSAHTYLALRLLGYPRIRNYIGSWKEWGDRLDLPIASCE